MKKYVYVIQENGSWDYEFTGHTEVYAKFEDALHTFKGLVKTARLDMQEWLSNPEDIAESEQINLDAESASFEIYEDGDYTKLHDDIKLLRKEIL